MNKKNTLKVFLFFVLFFPLPIYLTLFPHKHQFGLLTLFYLVNLILVFFILRRASNAINKIKRKIGDEEEKSNILSGQNSKEIKTQSSLKEKISRYASLKKIIEDLNSSLSTDVVAQHLVETAFAMIAGSQGTCVLYLIDSQTNSLRLYKTRKEEKSVVIKAKQGDIFDYWVLRHASPLLIEDTAKDFRFDLDKVKTEDFREVQSLISAPLLSGNNFLGVLRLDENRSNVYSQEDLRFLVTICDLGAVALENSLLYQNTQELAIHDGLTGLFTKGHFLELLKIEIKSSIRHKRPISMLMLDIDFFKNYNDKFGHMAGDLVLKALSASLAEVIKERLGIVCRFGGEEFCVLLPGQNKPAAMETAELLRSSIANINVLLRRQKTKVTVSIGVATLSSDIADEKELIMIADKAMYAAKASGRNCVVGAK
ncbi:MAG: sensor domain-containing diguanylate cyclase [Candidatus Omnitrophica bacterium]|nr:sensor domain-containing diguanylate cyclase [Candidatus Omnitrophota bacterium]